MIFLLYLFYRDCVQSVMECTVNCHESAFEHRVLPQKEIWIK